MQVVTDLGFGWYTINEGRVSSNKSKFFLINKSVGKYLELFIYRTGR